MRIPVTDCICFRAGKVHLYSDFDGTYLPVAKEELKQKTNINLDVYCRENSELLEKTKGNLDFHISTGRNFDSFFKMMEFLKQKNIHLPLPDSLITENGSDEFIKTGSDKDFYEKDIFPFSETKTFKTKEERSLECKNLNMKYGLNKLFDVKKSIKDAIKNKDIVIVAGNGSNDFDMLNPLNYVDLKKYEENQKTKNFSEQKHIKNLKISKLYWMV